MTWTQVYTPVASGEAQAAAHKEVRSQAEAQIERRSHGMVTTVLHEAEAMEASQHLADIGAGLADFDYWGAMTVTASTREDLRLGVEAAMNAAAMAGLEVRSESFQHGALYGYVALPLAGGLR